MDFRIKAVLRDDSHLSLIRSMTQEREQNMRECCVVQRIREMLISFALCGVYAGRRRYSIFVFSDHGEDNPELRRVADEFEAN